MPPYPAGSTGSSSSPGEDAVARAAVLILRTLLPADAGVAPDRVRILPDADVLTDRLAAERLAGMARPLECRPSAAAGVLELACGPLSPGSLVVYEWRLRDRRERGGLLERAGLRAVRESGRDGILIVGRGEEVLLRTADVERLEREFEFDASYSVVTGTPAKLGYDPPDAAWLVRFSPAPVTAVRVDSR